MISKGFKYFIGFRCGEKIVLLCIKFFKVGGMLKSFDESKYILSLIKDKKLLKKYYDIWGKVSNNINKSFDKELAYKTLTKIK